MGSVNFSQKETMNQHLCNMTLMFTWLELPVWRPLSGLLGMITNHHHGKHNLSIKISISYLSSNTNREVLLIEAKGLFTTCQKLTSTVIWNCWRQSSNLLLKSFAQPFRDSSIWPGQGTLDSMCTFYFSRWFSISCDGQLLLQTCLTPEVEPPWTFWSLQST